MGKTAATHGNGVRADDPRIERIFIVGGGGFGREAFNWVRDAWPTASAKVAGFLSADGDLLDGHNSAIPIMADPADFQPDEGCAFVLGIGIPQVRRHVAESLLSRGATFLTVVHPTAIVAPTAVVGDGSIICPYAIVSDAANLGKFTLVNFHSSLGHDAATGDFSVLSPYAALGGGARIGADTFLGLHASVGPGKRLGPRTKVSANSAALSDAPADALIFGVPGRVTPNVGTEARPEGRSLW